MGWWFSSSQQGRAESTPAPGGAAGGYQGGAGQPPPSSAEQQVHGQGGGYGMAGLRSKSATPFSSSIPPPGAPPGSMPQFGAGTTGQAGPVEVPGTPWWMPNSGDVAGGGAVPQVSFFLLFALPVSFLPFLFCHLLLVGINLRFLRLFPFLPLWSGGAFTDLRCCIPTSSPFYFLSLV